MFNNYKIKFLNCKVRLKMKKRNKKITKNIIINKFQSYKMIYKSENNKRYKMMKNLQ